jgi:Tol biopolymer transport system component/DNA-binding winged helix-turn-helix (wHTH) protein
MGVQSLNYQFDDVEVRGNAREVVRQGKSLPLEPKAFRVLIYLIENRDRAVGKDELIEKLWDGVAVTDNALSRIVAQLRKELGDDARQPRYILTLPTMGYRFVAELTPPAAPLRAPRRLWPPLAAAAILTVLGAAAVRWYPRPHPPAAAVTIVSRSVQITTSPGLDVNGSFNPDGSSLVYSSNRSGRFEIYLHPLDSRGRELQLTSDGEENVDPSWSHDGSSIAFYSVRRHGICVVPATGGTVRQITKFGTEPVWSPDGQWIAFAAGSLNSLSSPFDINRALFPDIWTVAPDGSGLREAIKLDSDGPWRLGNGLHSFCWWPDGKRILLSSGFRMFLADPASGKAELLADVLATGHAVPAPDGQSVYYANGSKLFRLPLSGDRKPVQVFDGDTRFPVFLSLSRAGNRLAFSQMAMHSELWQAQPGAEPQPVFREVGVRVLSPSFSPDGQKLAFGTSRFGSNWELWMANADGSGATALCTANAQIGIRWNADGSGILYKDKGGRELRRFTPGGASELLLKSPFPFIYAQVAPDERSVIYQFGNPPNLWKLAFGSKPRQLTFDRDFAGWPFLSGDGKWIAYQLKRGADTYAAVMDADGGQQRQLTRGPSADYPYSFSADGRRIASATFQDAIWNIATLDRVSGERKILTHYTDFGSYVRYPAWRPHTEQVVFERTSSTGNIYAIAIPLE